jgi:hypothetical protein
MAGPYYAIAQTGDSVTNPPDLDATLGNRVVDGLQTMGGLAMIERVYRLLGSEVVGEFIRICRNPVRAKLVPHLSAVCCDNPGTTLTLDIGDAENPDRYADAIVLSAGGTVLLSSVSCLQTVDPIVTSDDPDDDQGDWIYATVNTANTLTAGADLRFKLVFQVNS